ncbi:carbamate kinase [Synechocystis salina]|uniref:Carbamate kinase n=1 Tax=Synechocystis salina LEGE 00031 TaxID=1828736 RepID=A0ABR9VUK5_9SYNC|nr:carbamate kinase [Synechocystis salina]MBE9241722.1 carbamate kinase [Synechocystis salina LEGE 00041]MBE9255035.1 carbamate kinase [Synechocystis salina LEGE 00031]
MTSPNPRPIVIALGGNALLQRGQPPEVEIQKANIRVAALAIAKVVQEYSVVVTHGNGPQVGLLALQGECEKSCKPYPLDVLGAETEGMIGYLLEQELRNQLPGRDVVTLLTQIVVDRQDPAFLRPSKPIGPIYDLPQAQQLAQARGWAIAADGQGYRRVVASPEPQRIIELPTIQLLVNSGALVVCAGGGGIPIVVDEAGGMQGVEAVIDKDLAAALLAKNLQAQGLLLLTDTDGVYENWGTNYSHRFERTTPKNLRRYRFAEGSMGPKVEAACRFVEGTGQWCGIGQLGQAWEIIHRQGGTMITP